jgi:DNA polymerase-3 subunit beta
MKFIVSSGNLLQALNITGKCIGGKSIIPILDCFLFDVRENKLKVTASNNEVFLTTSLEIKNKGANVSIAVPAVQISGLIKSFADQPLAFEIKERRIENVLTYNVEIKSPTGTFKLPAENGEDYPAISDKDQASFKIPAHTLVNGIEKTLFAASTDQLNPKFCGVNLSFDSGKALFTATNQHILSTFSYTANIEFNRSLIIPTKVLSILLSSPKAEEIQVSIGSNSITFQLSEETTLKSLLINERFVDYQSIIPTNNESHMIIDRALMLSALKRVIQLSNTITKSVKLTLSEGQCAISAEDVDLGQNAHEELPCQYQSEQLSIGLIGNQVIECINKFDTQEAHFYFSAPNRAVIIRDHEVAPTDKQNLMLTMPIMLAQ